MSLTLCPKFNIGDTAYVVHAVGLACWKTCSHCGAKSLTGVNYKVDQMVVSGIEIDVAKNNTTTFYRFERSEPEAAIEEMCFATKEEADAELERIKVRS